MDAARDACAGGGRRLVDTCPGSLVAGGPSGHCGPEADGDSPQAVETEAHSTILLSEGSILVDIAMSLVAKMNCS